MGRWLVKRGYLSKPPCEDVEKVGRANRGKGRLTIDEARKLANYCLALAVTDSGALGALLTMGLGLRSGEIRGVAPKDIDDEGRVLAVRREVTKSKDGRRLVIPEWLRGIVSAERFPLGLSKNGLLSRVRTLRRCAKVPEVSAHGLRGTHATLAATAETTSEYVAASLGHTSPIVTERHYAQAGGIQSGLAERAALKLIEGGRK